MIEVAVVEADDGSS